MSSDLSTEQRTSARPIVAIGRALAALIVFAGAIVLFLVAPLALAGVACATLWWHDRLRSLWSNRRKAGPITRLTPLPGRPAAASRPVDRRGSVRFGGEAAPEGRAG